MGVVRFLLLTSFAVTVGLAQSPCSFTAVNTFPTQLSDLRKPTPFTFVETNNGLNANCSTSPFIYTQWRTAYVGGVPYPADGVVITIDTDTSYATYVFSKLLLTVLQPGEIISMTNAFMPGVGESWLGIETITTAFVLATVPTSISLIAGSATSIPPSTSTPTVTTKSTQSSSGSPPSQLISTGEMGGIIAAVIIATGAIVAAVSYWVFKHKTMKQPLSRTDIGKTAEEVVPSARLENVDAPGGRLGSINA